MLCVCSIKSRRKKRVGHVHVARLGDRSGVYRALVGRCERMKPPGKPSILWKGNIKMNLEVLRGVTDWIDLAQVR
jgi:hypothetical protein